jgi:hypothetical protein
METYEAAVERCVDVEHSVDHDMQRVSQVQMMLTGCPYALHLNYFEDAETRTRRLAEHEVLFDRHRAVNLLGALMAFAARSRFKAQSDSEAAA